jgi:hypothetical protein
MSGFLRQEWRQLRQFLQDYGRETVIVAFGTLFIVLHKYNPIYNEWVHDLLYNGVFPILAILVVLRKNPLDFGLRWGNPRVWGLTWGSSADRGGYPSLRLSMNH